MHIDMRPAFRLMVAEHRDMIRGNLGPLDRAADDLLARLARLDDEDITGSFSALLPVDAAEDCADALGAEGAAKPRVSGCSDMGDGSVHVTVSVDARNVDAVCERIRDAARRAKGATLWAKTLVFSGHTTASTRGGGVSASRRVASTATRRPSQSA